MSRRLRTLYRAASARLRDESGFVMLIVIAMIAILAVISATLMDTMRTETARANQGLSRDASYQAAEAGIDAYIAKLVDNSNFAQLKVADGESTRFDSGSGQYRKAGDAWQGSGVGPTWSYPYPRDTDPNNPWHSFTLSDGKNTVVQYNLQVYYENGATATNGGGTTILSVGRVQGQPNTERAIKAVVQQTSISEFQFFVGDDLSFGASATTYGKIYVGMDANGFRHSLTFAGTAYGDLMTEGTLNFTGTLAGSPTPQKYDYKTIRNVIKSPPLWSSFQPFVSQLRSDAIASGIYLSTDPKSIPANKTPDVWMLTFNSSGTVTYQGCYKHLGQPIDQTKPDCPYPSTTKPVPANGAIWSDPPVEVEGTVNGRATVGTLASALVGNNTTYLSSSDVLGVMAQNGDVEIPNWAPSTMTVQAAMFTLSGKVRSYSQALDHASITIRGSISAPIKGYMTMFNSRTYYYDQNLLNGPPPYYPTINNSWGMVLFREVPVP